MRHENGFDSIGTHYTRLGDPDQPTVVFIHGLGMDQNFWQPQMAAFLDRYQIVIYDILGHGESPMPDADVALEDMVDQLHGLIHELEISKAHIIGHSMGALIAIGFTLAHPDRTATLTAMNGVYDRPADVRKAAEARAAEILAGGTAAGNEATFRRWFGDTPDASQQVAIDWVRAKLPQNDPVGYGRIYNLFSRSDDAYVGQLGAISCPALYITGELDPNSTPAMSEQMAAATPAGRAVILDGERHMMSYVSPEGTNAVLEKFLHDPQTIADHAT